MNIEKSQKTTELSLKKSEEDSRSFLRIRLIFENWQIKQTQMIKKRKKASN